MSRHVPILTEVVTRAWGLDDPRVVSLLRAENQPGRSRRATAVEARATAAGWPPEFGFGNQTGKLRLSATMRRLEGQDFSFQGRARRYAQRVAAANVGRQEVHADLDDGWDLDHIDDEEGSW
jgi:hypothetical protein